MMSPVNDHYDVYYSDKLWALLPEVYRSEDTPTLDGKGPLRDLVERIGAHAAVLRRSIDRLWDDAFIETCDDWLIPYLAELLETNLVPSLDARGQRLDVAKTISYRRRKGTVAVLEEIASDITGWDAHVVEFFRLLGRTRHGLDPAIGLPEGGRWPDDLQLTQGIVAPFSRTSMGGFADLRNRYAASRTATAFEEFAHTADVRRGAGRSGWYNIPRLGVFVWRRKSYALDYTTPVSVNGCPDWYTFDPTGRDVPLHCAASRRPVAAAAPAAREWQMPGAIDDTLLRTFAADLYPASAAQPHSVSVHRKPGVAPYQLVPRAQVQLWPERGRFRAANGPLFGVYHYGFSSEIGAGSYDRRDVLTPGLPLPALPEQSGGGLLAVPAGAGTTTIGDSLTYGAPTVAGIANVALVARNEKRPVLRMTPGSEWRFTGTPGATLILDGLYVSGPDIVLAGEFASVVIRCATLDPGTAGDGGAVFAASADGRPLRPAAVFVDGVVGSLHIDRSICGPIRVRGTGILSELRVTDSIVQGLRHAAFGNFSAAEIIDPLRLAVKWQTAATPLTFDLRNLLPAPAQAALAAFDGVSSPPAPLASALVTALNSVVNGPSFYTAARFSGIRLSPAVTALRFSNPAGDRLRRLNRLLLEEAFAHELAPAALAVPMGEIHLDRVTVLGRMWVHQLHASEAILDEMTVVEDTQRGCVRFSAWATGSVLPRQYESVRVTAQPPIFTSRAFPQPGYAQLIDGADAAVEEPTAGSIVEGAQNGSEMGAFHREQNAIKQRSLLTKFEEYMPMGLSPVVIQVT